jgi:flagellar biosynthesis protein FlhB
MSESQGRKTEEPTERRLEDARKEGQVDRSRDVTSALVVGIVLLGFWLGHETVGMQARELARYALAAPLKTMGGDPWTAMEATIVILREVLRMTMPVVFLAIVVGVMVNVVQTRGLFAPAALRPDASRLNPAQGFKSIFSRRSAIELVKTLVKIAFLAFAMFVVIKSALPVLVKLPALPLSGVAQVSAMVFARFFGLAVLALALVAMFDYWFQRFEHRHKLRMTREEVKRERRDNEGDPMMRARRRAIAKKDADGGELDRVRQASVVLHADGDGLAVALYVAPSPDNEVWLVMKGAAHVCQAIVATANDAKVRVVRDASLTRAVYGKTAIDSDVAPKLAKEIRRLFA